MTERLDTTDDGKFVATRRISLPQRVYSVEEYAAVRQIITTWLSANHRRLLFIRQ